MRSKTSILALLLGLGMYGLAPVVTSFELFGAAPAHAEDGDGNGGDDNGGDGDGGDDNGGDDNGIGDSGDDDSGSLATGADGASDAGAEQTTPQASCEALTCLFTKQN